MSIENLLLVIGIWQNESKSEPLYLAFTPLNEITKWNYDYEFGGKFFKFWFVKHFVKWIILFSIVRKINLLNELNIWNFFLKGKPISIESMDTKTFSTFVSHTFYISTKCCHLSSRAHELSMHKTWSSWIHHSEINSFVDLNCLEPKVNLEVFTFDDI